MNFFNKFFDPTIAFENHYTRNLIERFRFTQWHGDIRVDLEHEFIPVRELDLALGEHSHLVLTGASGSGKTTTLAQLALKHARMLLSDRRDALVPVYFSARELHPQALPRLADLPRSLGLTNSPPDYFTNAMANKRLLLLVDNLDALEPQAIERLVSEFSSARIVATSQDAIPRFFEFKLPAWRDLDIEKFARLRFDSQASSFLAALKASGVPRPLTSNPLTMAMLAHAWQSEKPFSAPAPLVKGGEDGTTAQLHQALDIKALPAQRTALFEAYAQSVIGNEDDTAKMLEGVALAIQRKKPASREFVSKSRGFLLPTPNQTCDFIHDLWRAYFAARAARRAPDLTTIKEHIENAAWREVILFYAGLGNADEFVSALVASGDLILAGSAIAHAKEVSAELRESVTKELMGLAWDGDRSAAAVLGEMQSDAAMTALASKLKDPDPVVRARAAEILGLLQMDRALEYLLPQMRDVNGDTRDKVIQVLGHSLSNRVIEPLLGALRGDPRAGMVDTRLRVAAAHALGQVGSDKAVPALIVDLQTGEPQVRPVAAQALKRIASPLMIKPLKGILLTADEETRQYAAEILASINGDGI